MDLISIIMPTYERSDMIVNAIDSIINQTYQFIELIIVDDNEPCSTAREDTKRKVAPYLELSNVKYILHEKNRGGSEARNTGIKHALGRYITFLDDDDEYLPEKIEKQYNFYKKVFPNDDGFINSPMKVYNNGKYSKTTKTKVDYNNLLFSAVAEKIVGTPTLFIPKKMLEAVEGFTNLSKGQEWYLTVKLIENGYKFRNMEEPLVKVNIHDMGSIYNGHKSVKKREDGLSKIFEIQKSYYGLFNERQIRELEYNYLLAMANCYLDSNSKKSLGFFVSSFKYKVFDVKGIKYLIKLSLKVLSFM